ncbi:MAG: lamin tail domain-containing protein [Candidatus Bipolaricaulia bacterium]
MRIVKWAVIAMFMAPVLLGATTFGVDGESYPEVCNPHPRDVGPIHISYINCVAEEDEVVTVFNGTNRPVDMTGYALTNASRGLTFVFEPTPVNDSCCTLGPNEVFRIHTGIRNQSRFQSPHDLHWLRAPGVPEPERIWDNAGDVANLLNPQGETVDTYAYGQP